MGREERERERGQLSPVETVFFFLLSSNRHFRLCARHPTAASKRITKAKTDDRNQNFHALVLYTYTHVQNLQFTMVVSCLVGFFFAPRAFTSLHFPVSGPLSAQADQPTSGLIRFFLTCVCLCVFSRLLRPIMNFLSKRTVMFFFPFHFFFFLFLSAKLESSWLASRAVKN